jgi:hypothetical protein
MFDRKTVADGNLYHFLIWILWESHCTFNAYLTFSVLITEAEIMAHELFKDCVNLSPKIVSICNTTQSVDCLLFNLNS